jgi:hypothetical protein
VSETVALVTPSTLLTARSTALEHAVHDIPNTVNLTFIVYIFYHNRFAYAIFFKQLLAVDNKTKFRLGRNFIIYRQMILGYNYPISHVLLRKELKGIRFAR